MTKKPVTTVISLDEVEDRKRALAYQMWEDEGRPEGKAEEHWDRASLLVMEMDFDASVEMPGWLKRNEMDQAKPELAATLLKPLDKPIVAEELSRIPAKRSAA
jgi:Protein of unknown function (DUF2934)